MEVCEKTNPNFEKKMSNALKANRAIHRVTFNSKFFCRLDYTVTAEILHLILGRIQPLWANL